MNFENDPGRSETRCVDYIKSQQLPVDSTIPVKSYPSNKFGLYDMHGNVYEWCSDWYGDYPDISVTDPGGPSSGSYRVLRGGSWNYTAQNSRSAFRDSGSPGDRYVLVQVSSIRTTFEMLEPCDEKLSRTVLRGLVTGDSPLLPDLVNLGHRDRLQNVFFAFMFVL